ncbi:hypothetical protein MKW94_001623 [Papaver nudicaule]|uniref:Pentatricopeptide repeat-containing protein n=1 Tax=Papaver nudicaule TaxID=74823 RepID=A0AA41RSW4_PAPNU|nr:hypothetical protein [Papaver nudicaule]
MSFISSSAAKKISWRTNITSTTHIFRVSNPCALKSLLGFCSNSSSIGDKEENGVSDSQGNENDAVRRIPRGKRQTQEKLEIIISRMMENRAWTTRLQNSIRTLVPEFDHTLVYNVLDTARNSEHALQFFRWVEKTGYRHDRSTTLKIIEILGRDLKNNHARCILLDMPKKGGQWDEDFFIELIYSYGKSGIVQESVNMFQKMKELGVERSIKTYDALFQVILRKGREAMARRFFNAMLQDGVMPTCRTYNIMIGGFFLSEKVKTAGRFFKEMQEREISPDGVTYNTMINGYCRVKQMEEAEKFFVEMKEKKLNPDVISYTTMIKGYVSTGRVDDGLRLFEEMTSAGIEPTDITYSTLLPGLCEADKMPEAHKLFKDMVAKHIAPRDKSIFLRLISCQCKLGNMDSAADVLEGMKQLSIPTEAAHYGVLIENFCRAGVHDRAIDLLDKVIESEILLNPRSTAEIESSAYNPMIEYLCNHGHTGKAEAFLRQLLKKGIQDPVVFNNVLRGHSKEGSPEPALEILQIMRRRGVPSDADAYRALVESFLRKGEPADAKTALDGMIESGHTPGPELFRYVMESLFNDGRVQTASRVMKNMIEKGVKENMDLVAKILEALFMRGHVEEAVGRVNLLLDHDCIPDFDSLLNALCEKQKTIAAQKLLEFGMDRDDCAISFSSYDKVLDALLAAGKTLNAYSILCKISESGGLTDKSEDLIRRLNAEGNTKQADILSRMMKGGDGAFISSKKGKKKVPVISL